MRSRALRLPVLLSVPLPRRALLLAAALGAAAGASPAAAQRVEVQLPPRAGLATEGPLVRGTDLLGDRRVRELLQNGFPARFHYRVELWSTGGWFNDLERRTEWDVIVRYDPLDHTYRVAHIAEGRGTLVGVYRSLDELREAIEQPARAPISPPRARKRYYYNVALDVELLSLSDLDEVEQWLRGELTPAVRGQRNPGTAIGRGVRTLFVRLLGAERRHFEVRTPTFRPG